MSPKASQEDYTVYRFEKARQTLQDAKSLSGLKSWNSSINRLYYACFYAVLSLFSKYNINSHSHSGVKTQLSLHFVRTGLISKEFGMLYGDLFDMRHKGDYGDFYDFEEQDVIPLLSKVDEFLRVVEMLLAAQNENP